MTRIDRQFSEKLNLFGRYSFDQDKNTNPEANNLPGVTSSRGSRLDRYHVLDVAGAGAVGGSGGGGGAWALRGGICVTDIGLRL